MNTKYRLWYAAMFSVLFFNACKKDGELNSKELKAVIKSNGGDVHVINLAFTRTPVLAYGDSIAKVLVGLTREAASEVLVSIAPDDSKVAAYNSAKNTSLTLLPAGNYRIVSNGPIKIPAGSVFSADSLKLEILDRMKLTDDKGYLLPLTIREISSKDRGITPSNNYGTVYVTVKGTYSNIEKVQTPLAGTVAVRTGWVVTVSNTTAGALGPAMLDGNNATSWRSSNSSTAAKWLSIDMGSARQVNGFRLTPNYVSFSENATAINVSTSVDNVTWTSQGQWKGTGPVAGSTAANPDLKHINFINPVQARYVRFDMVSWTSGNRVGVAEFNVIQ